MLTGFFWSQADGEPLLPFPHAVLSVVERPYLWQIKGQWLSVMYNDNPQRVVRVFQNTGYSGFILFSDSNCTSSSYYPVDNGFTLEEALGFDGGVYQQGNEFRVMKSFSSVAVPLEGKGPFYYIDYWNENQNTCKLWPVTDYSNLRGYTVTEYTVLPPLDLPLKMTLVKP